ncbi:hypothetical protein AB0D12_18820 [Streptomyces sp. NPDC048479]
MSAENVIGLIIAVGLHGYRMAALISQEVLDHEAQSHAAQHHARGGP